MKKFLGIEFGSTRIKAVLADENFQVMAQGAHDWENELKDGIWSYSMDAIEAGIRDAYAKCAGNYAVKTGEALEVIDAIGISGMMHGYLAFDEKWSLLVPFRTWRNTITAKAAAALSERFRFNIPQRWSIAHYYEAILNREEHVDRVRYLTTLAGLVHYRLSGVNALGVGEASGMFPVDTATGDYDKGMLETFREMTGIELEFKLPKVLPAGADAGRLTEAGAKWLDPSGKLRPGALMAPPEGDAGTGMVATNAVAPGTGNVSAGTSIFAMIVLKDALKGYYPEIDVVATPAGKQVAMVHCNNCTNEINAWVKNILGGDYGALFRESLKGEKDCGGVVVVPYLSGEPVTGKTEACLKVMRTPDSAFTLANFMRAQIYSAFVSLKLGMDILAKEHVSIDSLMGHGGIFKDKGIAQQYLADALDTSVTCMSTATEGGPWGMAVLAAFAYLKRQGGLDTLETFLAKKVFAGAAGETLEPDPEGVVGFNRYARNFKEAL